jgi:hypothetical protein
MLAVYTENRTKPVMQQAQSGIVRYVALGFKRSVQQWFTWCGVKDTFEISVYSKEYIFPILSFRGTSGSNPVIVDCFAVKFD